MANNFPCMDWSGSDHAESFGLFRQKMELYLKEEDITEAAAQARKICRGLGDEGLRRLNASGLKTADKKKPSELWKFFESHLRLNVNFRIHRLQLMQYRQRADETLDDFVTRARTLALKCDFSDDELAERMMELIIACTPHDAFRKELLGKPKGHTLASFLTEGRQHEALTAGDAQVKSLAGQAGNIDAVRKQYKQQQRQCRNCGLNHAPRKCPANGDICRACGKLTGPSFASNGVRIGPKRTNQGKRNTKASMPLTWTATMRMNTVKRVPPTTNNSSQSQSATSVWTVSRQAEKKPICHCRYNHLDLNPGTTAFV